MKCNLNEDETVMHVVVECDKYDGDREKFLDVLRSECEEVKVTEWLEREDRGLGVLLGIESGVNNRVLEAMKDFLEEVWKKREE